MILNSMKDLKLAGYRSLYEGILTQGVNGKT